MIPPIDASRLIECLGKPIDSTPDQAWFNGDIGERETGLEGDIMYLHLPDIGVNINASLSGFIESIFLCGGHAESYSKFEDNFSRFEGLLPCGLRFSYSKEDVRKQLGDPTLCCEQHQDSILGRNPPWDRYDDDKKSIHLQYSSDCQNITCVTLMHPSAVP
ncbi:hypothetical protein [Stratiformator vulcanicus]|uniref:Uncharacterized protein n=1 Tax=Stratiformator vulcanicus TaxID=2527980 RepID=A0A517QWK1_9PLAN|nr:hypothetical protein [Stratiformator vulcanicus]QDT36042.1 hypothetical protein Pan189_03970 [Stratiformator vulcanicus]